jgi:DNA mismatch endonuclease (patch repair protein)
MQANRSRDTQPELELRSALHRGGLRFFTHRRPYSDFRCRADVVFPRLRVAVFIDGCFWHRCPKHGTSPRANAKYWRPKLARNVARDRAVDTELAGAGWTVLRVWEHDVEGPGLARVAAKIQRLVARRRRDIAT